MSKLSTYQRRSLYFGYTRNGFKSSQNKGSFKFDDVYGGRNKWSTLLDQDEIKRRNE